MSHTFNEIWGVLIHKVFKVVVCLWFHMSVRIVCPPKIKDTQDIL